MNLVFVSDVQSTNYRKGNIDAGDKGGKTALYYAVALDLFEVVELLLEEGAGKYLT